MPVFGELGSTLIAGALGGTAYQVAAANIAGRMLWRSAIPRPVMFPSVTLLKPLYGDEPGLEEALASALRQDYPAEVQVIFGVRNPLDPALAVVDRLRARFPGADVMVVADPRLHGSNHKISNLINMAAAAKHDLLVLADSDITVPRDYLRRIAAEVLAPGVGIVSCLYTGSGRAGFWSRLSAMAISYHFLPNAIFGIGCGLAFPCFGSTVALKRETLSRIGGFEAFVDYLADDYEMGRAVRKEKLAIVYPSLTVEHGCSEASLGALVHQELRWARTIRVINPVGHWGSIVTFPLPLAILGTLTLGFSPATGVVLATALAGRLFLKSRIDRLAGRDADPIWLVPLRDMLSFGVFVASLFGGSVSWRGLRLRVDKSGAVAPS